MHRPDLIRAAGWRQGSVIAKDNASEQFHKLLQPYGKTFSHWLVISQDCDLVHRSYDVEPHVELLGCTVAKNADGNLKHGKNPRRIQFSAQEDKHPLQLDASIHNRLQIQRSVLEGMKPSVRCVVEPADTRMVVGWVGRRYTRSAFPDAFNERIREKQKGIKGVLERNGDVVSNIFMSLSTFDELAPGQPYTVAIRVAMKPEDYDDMKKRDRALLACNALEIGFNECTDINVKVSEVVSEARFPLSDLAFLIPWDTYDYLSHSDD